jgi:hypothetical protein
VKGQDAIVAARMAGYAIHRLDLEDAPSARAFVKRGAIDIEYVYRIGRTTYARLVIEPTDAIGRLDLRCVFGLPVRLFTDADRWVPLLDRLIEFQPASVLTQATDGTPILWTKNEFVELG